MTEERTARRKDRPAAIRYEIVEQGTHETLRKRLGGIYRGLVERQVAEFISAAE